MKRIVSWIKTHKLSSVLIAILLWFVLRNNYISVPRFQTTGDVLMAPGASNLSMTGEKSGVSMYRIPAYEDEAAPTTIVSDRMVVRNSNMSLKVTNVAETINQIVSYIENAGGYMVDSTLSNPEDAATGNITVRVPEESLDETLSYFRSLSVKVVSENLTGRDVTDQYQDIEERLRILEGNKRRFEEIMVSAGEISDILQIQKEVLVIQSQIDSLKGQQQLLSQTAKLSKVTVYVATDELALPYAPEQPWRPKVVFQSAVRSLLSNLQNIGSLVIWIVVYSIVWGPVALIVLYIRKRKKASSPSPRPMTN